MLDRANGLRVNGEYYGDDVQFPHTASYVHETFNTSLDRYVDFLQNDEGIVSVAQTANLLKAYFIETFDDFYFHLAAIRVVGTSGGNVRIGLYSYKDGYPYKLLSQTDSISLSAINTTFQGAMGRQIKRQPMFVVAVFDSTPTVGGVTNTGSMYPVLGVNPAAGSSRMYAGYSVSFTFGELPSIFPSGGAYIQEAGTIPVIGFKVKKIIKPHTQTFTQRATLNGKTVIDGIKIVSALKKRTGDSSIYQIINGNNADVIGVSGSLLNAEIAYPFFVDREVTLSKAFIECTVASAGALGNYGIYTSKWIKRSDFEGWFPNKLICNHSNLDLSTTGIKQLDWAPLTLPSGNHFFAFNHNNSTIRLTSLAEGGGHNYSANNTIDSRTSKFGVSKAFAALAMNYVLNPVTFSSQRIALFYQ